MAQARTFSLGGSSRTGLFIAVLLAAVTGVLVFALLRSNDDGDSVKNFTGGSETTVVTANQDISARTEIKEDMLQVTKVPSNALLAGAYSDRSLVVGRVSRIPIYKGEQLVQDKLATEDREDISSKVPSGRRGVGVSVTSVVAAGGLLRPGDRVDILGVVDVRYTDVSTGRDFEQTQSFTLAQDIEVLAVAERIVNLVRSGDSEKDAKEGTSTDQPDADPDAKVVTLALTPLEAQNMLLASEKGKIRLAVRAPNDHEIVELPNSNYLNLADPEFAKLLQDALRVPQR